jgi:2-methylcitrate dehydratase PrpD
VVQNAVLTPSLGAAIGTRLLSLGCEATRYALGIAEFHGPCSPVMRRINHLTMLKNGAAQGTFSGVTAPLAANDFTGAPAVLVENAAESAVFGRHIGVLPALAGKLLRNAVIRADSGGIDRAMQL